MLNIVFAELIFNYLLTMLRLATHLSNYLFMELQEEGRRKGKAERNFPMSHSGIKPGNPIFQRKINSGSSWVVEEAGRATGEEAMRIEGIFR